MPMPMKNAGQRQKEKEVVRDKKKAVEIEKIRKRRQ